MADFRRLSEAPYDRNALCDFRKRLKGTVGKCNAALQVILGKAEAMAARGPQGAADPQVQGQIRKLESEKRRLKARILAAEAAVKLKDEKLKEAKIRSGAPRADSSNSGMPGTLVIGGGSRKSKR
ncbi:MAG: hypothetical protein LBW85_07190 [Deltaproteobacteria bacterium]|nr:hypothetical protein [Deltaproteobacteria bacterium]